MLCEMTLDLVGDKITDEGKIQLNLVARLLTKTSKYSATNNLTVMKNKQGMAEEVLAHFRAVDATTMP